MLLLFLWPEKERKPETTRVKPWGKFRPGDRLIILGLPFTGKSRLAAKLTEEADRVVYFDPMSDYSGYSNAKPVTVSELLENPSLLEEPRFRLAVIPNEDTLDDDLEDTIRLVRGAGNAILVFDEVGDYRQRNEVILNKIARNGRHDGIVPIYVSQVAIDIPLTVRRLATRVYSYLQVHKEDIDALAERYGQAFADSVKNAKPGELTQWTLPTLPHSLPKTKQLSG